MKKILLCLSILVGIIYSNSTLACNGFTPAVTSNTYIGNGEYLLSIEICEFVSNSNGLNDFAFISGLLITVNGANIISVVTPSLTGATSGVTIFPTVTGNQIEFGDWGNQNAPEFLSYGDPQECWTIEVIVDGPATNVDVWGSSSESVFQPGFGMVDNNGTWGCGQGLAIPPATCDASWNPPVLCVGSSSLVYLDTTTLGSGTFSGPGVNSGNGIFDPSGLTGNVSVTFTVGDQFFNCAVTQDIVLIDLTPPSLQDTSVCAGDPPVQLDASSGGSAPGACDYTLVLDDSYGDGWNGGQLDIYINGVLFQLNATVASCGGFGNVPCQNIITLPVIDGDLITLFYSAGSWNSENTITMFDANMVQVGNINNPPNGWLGGGITVSCPTPVLTYTWTPSAGLSNPNIANPIATVGSTTTYSVEISSPGLPCTSTNNVTVTIDPCGLPVELIEFKGHCYDNDVLLSWSTDIEVENDYFILEYSSTGSDFEVLATVDGQGNSSEEHHYGYRHKNPEAIANYYRLKQVDFDGKTKTYSAISVRCDNNSVKAFLNNYEQIVVSADSPILNIQLLDATGRTLYQGTNQIIDVSDHSATIFFLEIETTDFVARRKVINPK